MTGANTEPVTVPEYLKVVSAILRLSAPLLYDLETMLQEPFIAQEPLFKAWRILRLTARTLCERGACELSLNEAWELKEALKFCFPNEDHDYLLAQTWTERA